MSTIHAAEAPDRSAQRDGASQWHKDVEYWNKQLATPAIDLDGLDEIFDDAEARGWRGREEIEAFDQKANAMLMLSLLYQEKEEWADAIAIGQRHVAHLQERGEPIEAARRLTLLAGDYQQAGKYGEGIGAVERALDQLAEVERPKTEPGPVDEAASGRALTLLEREAIRGRAQRRLALLYQQMGDIDSALRSLGVDDCRLQVIDNALDAELQLHIARLCFDQGWDDSAAAAAQRVRSIAEPALEASLRHQLLAHDLLSIAAYVEGGEANWRLALRHTLAAIELALQSDGPTFPSIERGFRAAFQERLAYLYANLDEDVDALRYARQAIQNASGDPFGQLLGHNAEGFVHLRAGRWQEAEAALRQAAAGWEGLQHSVADDERLRATLLDAQLVTFELLQETLICSGHAAAALEVAERARARALGATLADDAGFETLSIDAMRALSRRIGAALLSWSILYDPYRGPSTGRVRGRQADLERRLLIGLVTPAGAVHTAQVDLAARRLAGEPSLERLIRDFRFTVDRREATRGRNRGAGDLLGPLVDTMALRGLDELLIEPVREHLPSDPDVPLVLVPQGRLFQVPFAALRAADDQHLIERHPLLVVPSLAVLDLLARRGEDNRPWHPNEVLVVGDPKYAAHLQLIQLGAAHSEANQIAELWGAEPLLGCEATLGEVVDRLGTARLVHLATHAWPTSDDPGARFPGTLALAPDDRALPGSKDGLLSADLIREHELGKFADLVVASACDTGGGHLTSDGVLGLARSFLANGTRRVVVSLWQVPDQPTEALMIDFHQALRDGVDVARALQGAMLTAIEMDKPYAQWAAFVAFGAPAMPLADDEGPAF